MFEGHVVGGFPGSTFKVQMTDQQRLLYDEMYCKQSVMLPHDIIASLYDFPEIYHPLFTGEPGRIEWYWGQNMDLFESLGDPNLEAWLVVILVPCLLGLFLSICWLGSGKKMFCFSIWRKPNAMNRICQPLSLFVCMGMELMHNNILRSWRFSQCWRQITPPSTVEYCVLYAIHIRLQQNAVGKFLKF